MDELQRTLQEPYTCCIDERGYMKHSNIFYTLELDGIFAPRIYATRFKNDKGFDLFKWNNKIYEGRTGCKVCAVKDIEYALPKVTEEIITKGIEKTGLSPRYTHPQHRKAHISPIGTKTEKTKSILAKDETGKSYYLLDSTIEGIGLFRRKRDKEYSGYYCLCNDYMIYLGSRYDKEALKNFLASIQYDLQSELERVLNNALADAEAYANDYYGKVLNREEEVKIHNAPIRAKRIRICMEEEAEKKRQEELRLQQEEAAFENALSNAEHAILNGKSIYNSEVNDKNIILELFRKHNINVPLRTQGWIKSSLVSVIYRDDSYSYNYNGNKSSVFFEYFDKLEAAIRNSSS